MSRYSWCYTNSLLRSHCYGKFPFNFKLLGFVRASSVALVSVLSKRRLTLLLSFVCILAVCGGQPVSEWLRMEACILRFNRRRRSNLVFCNWQAWPVSGWQRGLYHCIVCSSLGDEGCAASCEPFIVFSNVLDSKSRIKKSLAPTDVYLL